MRGVWAMVLVAIVVAVGAAFVERGPTGLGLSAIGLFVAGPAAVVCMVAVDGLRQRWGRGLAAVGLFAAGVVIVVAGMLHAAIGVGQGLGGLLAAVSRTAASTAPQPVLEVSVLAGLVAAAGCLFALVVGPPRPPAAIDELSAAGPL